MPARGKILPLILSTHHPPLAVPNSQQGALSVPLKVHCNTPAALYLLSRCIAIAAARRTYCPRNPRVNVFRFSRVGAGEVPVPEQEGSMMNPRCLFRLAGGKADAVIADAEGRGYFANGHRHKTCCRGYSDLFNVGSDGQATIGSQLPPSSHRLRNETVRWRGWRQRNHQAVFEAIRFTGVDAVYKVDTGISSL